MVKDDNNQRQLKMDESGHTFFRELDVSAFLICAH